MLFFFLLPLLLPGQAAESRVKVLLITQFFDFVKWPGGKMDDLPTFVVGIIGDTPLLQYRQLLGERLKRPGRTVKIKYINELNQVKDCHALIIAGTEATRIDEIIAVTENRPVLSVSDYPGFGDKGVLINFYRAGTKLKFEINLPAVRKSGLTFSAKLYKLARIIQ